MTSSRPSVEECRQFFLGEFEAASAEIERTDRVPTSLLERTASLGAFRLSMPAEYGGYGLNMVELIPYLEAAAMGPAAGRMLVHVNNGMWRPIARFGSDEQRTLVPRIGSGEAIVGIAVTEREGGSGRDMRTTAVRTGTSWRLVGEKYLITFADIADAFIVLAVTDERRGPDSLSTFLVARDHPGVRTTAEPLLGLAGIRLGTVTFEAELDDSHLLGRTGEGFAVLAAFLDHSRISLSACMVGAAQRALDEAVAFAKRRVTFGKPIAERQAIQVHVANMYADLLAARSMVRAVAEKSRAGEEFAVEAAATKLFCADMATRLADRCLQIHGGYGLTKASVAERISRDSRSWWMEEGTAEIQQLLISRRLLR